MDFRLVMKRNGKYFFSASLKEECFKPVGQAGIRLQTFELMRFIFKNTINVLKMTEK